MLVYAYTIQQNALLALTPFVTGPCIHADNSITLFYFISFAPRKIQLCSTYILLRVIAEVKCSLTMTVIMGFEPMLFWS